MSRLLNVLCGLILPIASALAQTGTYPYILKTFAGAFPLGDNGPATSALLFYPTAAIADASGNLFILDDGNQRIRKVTPDGKIATYAQFSGESWDMQLTADGTIYIAGTGGILRISPSGTQALVAGTGVPGFSGDGGAATGAQVGEVWGIALDAAGNIFFTDGSRVREVTTDGKIRTVAGTALSGFNGDNQAATSARLYDPSGIAVDAAGNVFVADTNNCRIRKFTVGGTISTVAGTGTCGQPVNGSATLTPMGWPLGLWLDATGNLFATDSEFMAVLKITPGGSLSRVAGNFNQFGSPADGPAAGVSLNNPYNVSADRAGNLFICEYSHLVRKITPDGNLTTVAGKIHFGGDGASATAALLDEPDEIALDSSGSVLIADSYRIRKVTPDGTINTWGGIGIPDVPPPNGSSIVGAKLPYIYAMAFDSVGAV